MARIVARSSLGENIDVDILSRPVDKDSNCTELCSVFSTTHNTSVVPSALLGAAQSMYKCLTTHRFRTVLNCCL